MRSNNDQTSAFNDLAFPPEFMVKFPKMTIERAKKYHARYINAISDQLIGCGVFKTGLSVQFSLKTARDYCGSFRYEGSRYYIWDQFNEIQQIIKVIDKGNNMTKQKTTAFISDEYYDLLIASSDGEQIMDAWFSEIAREERHDLTRYVPIDPLSLEHYIISCTEALNRSVDSSANYTTNIKRNLRHAQMIKVVSRWVVDAGLSPVPAWPHIAKMSPYGRRYYHGLSAQSVHRELRRGALGQYFQYDLSAAAYAIKLLMAESIFKECGHSMTGHFTYTKEYMELKGAIRRQLSGHISNYPDGLKLVKRALTAIGFGAKLQSAAWTEDGELCVGALNEIIRNQEDRESFMNDRWVVNFVAEQRQITDLIYERWTMTEEVRSELADIPNMMGPNGQLKKNQVVAYLFQTMEREIMDDAFGDQDYLIDIHDAVISKTPLDLLAVRNKLGQWSPWLKLEIESASGYYHEEADAEVIAHKARIAEEERAAARHFGRPVTKPGRLWVEYERTHDYNNECATGESKTVVASHLWSDDSPEERYTTFLKKW